MDAFERQMQQTGPSWAAFDMRMMFQGYLERGFTAGKGDLEAVTGLLGHAPRAYGDFARETALECRRRAMVIKRSGPLPNRTGRTVGSTEVA